MDEIEKLIQDLKSEDAEVRSAAASELGMVGGSSAVPALIEALEDEDGSVRLNASAALSSVGDASAVPALVKVLENEGILMRLNALLALGKIGNISAVRALIKALGDESNQVRSHAARVLIKILEKFETTEALGSFEENLKEGFAVLKRKCRDKEKIIEAKIEIAKLMNKIAERKEQLAPKRDMFLDAKPKPPKKGQTYHAVRLKTH